jgi:hypothetical protein
LPFSNSVVFVFLPSKSFPAMFGNQSAFCTSASPRVVAEIAHVLAD